MPSTPTETHGGESPDSHESHDHRSVWPIVAAFGFAGLYAGAALTLLAYSAETVPPILGAVVAVGGVAVAVAGLAGWLHEAYLERYGAGPADPGTRQLHVVTMVLFVFTDLGTFGAGFIYYAFIRVGAWPPAELPPLVGSLVLANTLVLVASSVTFHLAHRGLEYGRRRQFVGLLALTVALGVVFLAGQAFEYYEFIVTEGFTLADGTFASAFFGLTGLHGLHVALGVVLLAILLGRALSGHYEPERDTSVATVGIYWHFVDVVWLFLVAVLYLGAVVP
ncbi:heme-copper oxidase subunit III [Natrarchaeobius sp. A-rgal3]|uniref:cytochrome c oxidase subunit 3 n=1 Tax=Natrarchaeobius versutus TaxID=1679078 RepID=UPI00350F34DE